MRPSPAGRARGSSCTADESLRKFDDIMAAAKREGVAVRGYVSCVVGCPYQVRCAAGAAPAVRCQRCLNASQHMRGRGHAPGRVQGEVRPQEAARVAAALYGMGCYEVSMGDTIGVGTPASVAAMFAACAEQVGRTASAAAAQAGARATRGPGRGRQACQALPAAWPPAAQVPVDKLAAHMHDTYGQALANILAALQMGVSVVDSSGVCACRGQAEGGQRRPPAPTAPQAVGARTSSRICHSRAPTPPAPPAVAGLGGCPYAKGATGNVATEDVAYMLQGFGIRTGGWGWAQDCPVSWRARACRLAMRACKITTCAWLHAGVDMDQLLDASAFICGALRRRNSSRAAEALLKRRQAAAEPAAAA